MAILFDAFISVSLTTILVVVLNDIINNGSKIKEVMLSEDVLTKLLLGLLSWGIVWLLYDFLIKKRLKYHSFIRAMDEAEKNINGDFVFSSFKDCLIHTIDEIVQKARIQNVDSKEDLTIDLAYEFAILDGDDRGEKAFVNQDRLFEIRRRRILCFNLSAINRHDILYATEFSLHKFIGVDTRWFDDVDYRNKLKGRGCERIVFLSVDQLNSIINKKNRLLRFNNYLAWHKKKGWEVFLYITQSEISSLKELNFGGDTAFLNYVDLLIDKTKRRVLVQNKEQRYKIICDDSLVSSYISWFSGLPKEDDDENRFPVIINLSDIGNICKLEIIPEAKKENLSKKDKKVFDKRKELLAPLKQYIEGRIKSTV